MPGSKLESVPSHLTSIITLTGDEDDENSYYYIDNSALASLDLSNIEANKYIVCYSKGEVINVNGIEINGDFYYTKSLEN